LAATGAVTSPVAGEAPAGADPAGETERLHRLFDQEWELRLREDPLFATSAGRHEYDHLLPSVGLADERRRLELWRELLDQAAAIDPSALAFEDELSQRIFERQLRERIEAIELGGYRLPLTSDSGFHTEFARLPAEMPLADVDGYDDYLARLRAFPAYVDGYVELLRDGVEHGVTLPRVVLEGYEVTIASHVVDDPAASVFWRPFERFPAAVPDAERERLRVAGRAAITEAVVPGYRAFLDFMVGEYLPAARDTVGISEVPGGREYYAQRVRHFTTLEVDAEEVHEIGKREVARIRAEMEAIVEQVGFEGSFADFLHFLRTDPRFYAPTPEDLLKEAAYIAKRMDGQLPALFGTLPRLPYTVAPVPADLAPKYTGGRYVPAPAGGRRPGTYWVNTYDLPSRPLYTLTALTLHEAVPGHHLQIARAEELEGLPRFRRYDYISAFGEGWGLYSEWLGVEAGIYDDPYDHFGRLTYEMWRACRLVVDTGLHAFGWSRQRAIDYLAENTALSLHEVGTEVDRYISWPGQALAYKMGELEIRRLRRWAEAELGPRFDLRAFHDAVLGHGSVPLPELERVIERYVAERSGG
jgi:uncharacterized protein (DUF885 family)